MESPFHQTRSLPFFFFSSVNFPRSVLKKGLCFIGDKSRVQGLLPRLPELPVIFIQLPLLSGISVPKYQTNSL